MASLYGLLFVSVNFTSVFVFALPVMLVGHLIKKPSFGFHWVAIMSRFYFALFGIKVKISGQENNQTTRPCLLLANHQSYLDISTVLMIRVIAFISKIEIKRYPVMGWGMSQMGCVFVDRANSKGKNQVAMDVKEKMAEGKSFCVFPEGTRSRNGKMKRFHNGIFRIAKEIDMPILPVTIHNSGELLPAKTLKLKRGTIRVTIHPIVEPGNFEKFDEIRDDVWQTINKSLNSKTTS